MRFWVILSLFFTGFIFAEDHSAETLPRQSDLSARNQAYLSLCGSGKKPTTTTAPVKNEKAEAALAILKNRCAECHFSGSAKGGGLTELLSVESLISEGYVTPGKANDSLLIERINTDMPLGKPKLNKEEVAQLTEWINDGARSSSNASVPEVGLISTNDLEACMLKDLREQNREDQPFVRYLNLAAYYNSGRKDKLTEGRLALNKLLNSLSWRKEIKNTVPVDGTETLLRVDLRDYGWTPEMWETVVKGSPYEAHNKKSKELTQKTKTLTPYLRGDWLVNRTFKDFKDGYLYHTLLYDMANIPSGAKIGAKNADSSLERALGVSKDHEEKLGQAARAAFEESKVTFKERAIQRLKTPYGSYWSSDDFAKKAGQKITFDHPTDYKRDGGEYIFSLPNGLHGYLITDKDGNRLTGAPTNVVIDPFRVSEDGVVLNGLSCFNCHEKGMKKATDEVKFNFELLAKQIKGKETNLDLRNQIAEVNHIYPGEEEINKLIEEDEKAYAKALEQTGNTTSKPDPIFPVATLFDEPLDLKSMAAELEHSPDEVLKLIDSDAKVRSFLRVGKNQSTTRDVFENNFQSIKQRLRPAKDRDISAFDGRYILPFGGKDTDCQVKNTDIKKSRVVSFELSCTDGFQTKFYCDKITCKEGSGRFKVDFIHNDMFRFTRLKDEKAGFFMKVEEDYPPQGRAQSRDPISNFEGDFVAANGQSCFVEEANYASDKVSNFKLNCGGDPIIFVCRGGPCKGDLGAVEIDLLSNDSFVFRSFRLKPGTSDQVETNTKYVKAGAGNSPRPRTKVNY